jgi:predicted  nucleic acid-binding Zn-ribbon protein
MDAMSLAQMKRQMAWQVEETKKNEHELHVAELLLETTKKNVETLRKNLVDNKRKVDQYTREIQTADEQLRKQTFQQNRH